MPKAPTKMSASLALYILERAMKERLLVRDFDTKMMLCALDYFNKAGVKGCIYCGDEKVERWDHLIPIKAGGGTVLGNMVPACQPCDDSKSSKDYRAWLAGSAPKNPARGKPDVCEAIIVKVEAYQRHFGYVAPRDFRTALTPSQLAQYEAFLELVAPFRAQLAKFGLVTAPLSEDEADAELSC